jgi:ribosomal protein S21
MVEVLVERDFERAVQQFTRKCMQAGILRELRDRVGYLKPSEKRRLKERRSKNRRMKISMKKIADDGGKQKWGRR